MKKLNKKGFTLVELLAVIVILALLIVVVATTALPAMNNAKKNSLEVYAKRIVEQAKSLHSSAQIDIHGPKKADGSTDACAANSSGVITCQFDSLTSIMGADADPSYTVSNLSVSYASGKYTISGTVTGSGFTTTISTDASTGKVTYTTA